MPRSVVLSSNEILQYTKVNGDYNTEQELALRIRTHLQKTRLKVIILENPYKWLMQTEELINYYKIFY